jgi:hypothetical protein
LGKPYVFTIECSLKCRTDRIEIFEGTKLTEASIKLQNSCPTGWGGKHDDRIVKRWKVCF